jgi:hypothetical protein
MENNYTVAAIILPDNKIAFTNRKDNRTAQEVVAQGIAGYDRHGHNHRRFNAGLKHYGVCYVKNLFTNCTKAEGDRIKKTLIEYERQSGKDVLNSDM